MLIRSDSLQAGWRQSDKSLKIKMCMKKWCQICEDAAGWKASGKGCELQRMVFPGWLHSWLRVRSPGDTRGLQDSGGPASGRLYFARLDPSGRCGPAPNDAESDPAATHQTFRGNAPSLLMLCLLVDACFKR